MDGATYTVSCGPGTQTIRWLYDVAVARHGADSGARMGDVVEVRLDTIDGMVLDLEATLVNTELEDGDHVWAIC